jgi:hypothetical protein
MRLYGRYLLECAARAAKQSLQGALSWGPILGAGAIGAFFTYRGFTLIFPDGWQGVVLSAVAYTAVAWVIIFAFRFLCVAPFQLWKREREGQSQQKKKKHPMQTYESRGLICITATILMLVVGA